MPGSISPSRSMTVVISRSSMWAQSSMRGERKRQPASSRQKICIIYRAIIHRSQAAPVEGLSLGVPIDVERVAAIVMEVEPHAGLVGGLALAGLGGGVEGLEGHFGLLGAESALAAALPGE